MKPLMLLLLSLFLVTGCAKKNTSSQTQVAKPAQKKVFLTKSDHGAKTAAKKVEKNPLSEPYMRHVPHCMNLYRSPSLCPKITEEQCLWIMEGYRPNCKKTLERENGEIAYGQCLYAHYIWEYFPKREHEKIHQCIKHGKLTDDQKNTTIYSLMLKAQEMMHTEDYTVLLPVKRGIEGG